MKKLLMYTNWLLLAMTCSAAEDQSPRRPLLRRLITRSITIEDMAAEREVQEDQRRKAEEQLLDPNSPPIPPLPEFAPPVLPPVVLPTVIDMYPGQGSPRPMPRTPSPGTPLAPRRRLAVIPYSSYQPMTPPGEGSSPGSADMSPAPRAVTPEDPHARAVVRSVFLRLMDDDANAHIPENDEAPL